ncbi:hypothetical protein [Vulcanisaeta souniana]|uniref:hypothetical protein n=1 Tax=Vulcanisaeta souniana TaxID=164452 RepID=UPI001FB33E81|nr:hypothetical protein [Vulcanisaeta souniana]
MYRYRDSVLGGLMYLESIIWYNAIVPFLRTTIKVTPLSGEGLFIRRDAVDFVPPIAWLRTPYYHLSWLVEVIPLGSLTRTYTN